MFYIYKLADLVTIELLNGRVHLYGHDERLNDCLYNRDLSPA